MKTRGFRHPKRDLRYKTSIEKIESMNIKFLFTKRKIKTKKKKKNATEPHLKLESCVLK